jgi:hypothetical protein
MAKLVKETQWLSHRNAKHCELCKTPFRFTPVYLPNAPARLPVIEIARGISKVAVEYVQLGLRVLLVLALWGFVVPHATSCSWRLFFISSVHELLSLPQKELELDRIFSDWVVGVILSSFVVVTFLGFTSLREYLIQLDDGGNMDLLMEAVEANFDRLDPAVMSEVISQLETMAVGDVSAAMCEFHRALATRLIRRSSIPPGVECCLRFAAIEDVIDTHYFRREVSALLALAGPRLCKAAPNGTVNSGDGF